MEVVLIDDVEKLGKKGDIVRVKDGYFRNYLFPRKKALVCNESLVRAYEERKAREEEQVKAEKEQFEQLAARIAGTFLSLKVQTGEGEKLYGSVTAAHLADALAERGIQVDRHNIDLTEPIKQLGSYELKIRLHPEVTAVLRVKITKE
ncbi:MAG: 50S ribosomal protein L9 [Candidatus Omnitrophica bacterium]|nr:50S ribosomal protein L9 [Candidatus Omnitrophota bacterium]